MGICDPCQILFEKLLEKKIPHIILRILLHLYMKQECYIRWNTKQSMTFQVKNGVRQGAILSPCLFCTYLDTLIEELRNSGLGCHVGAMFPGALGYADDLILLCPTRKSLQELLKICESFAITHEMQFSTDPNPSKSKTKCLHFSRKKAPQKVPEVLLNNNSLPWVEKAKHLGNQLTTTVFLSPVAMDSSADIQIKKAIFFSKVHELKQQFGCYNPKILCKLVRIYGTSFYGSPLWALYSNEHLKLLRSWNTATKIIWHLPYNSHNRFIESLNTIPHLQSTLHSRYIGFIGNIMQSQKPHMKILSNLCSYNLTTVTGRNIEFLMSSYSCQSITELISMKYIIKNMRVYELQDEEKWKIPLLEEICLIKNQNLDLDFDEEYIQTILCDVATS